MNNLSRPRAIDLPCRFDDRPGTFRVYLGRPAAGLHPIHFQRAWLRESRDGEIEEKVLDHLAGERPRET